MRKLPVPFVVAAAVLLAGSAALASHIIPSPFGASTVLGQGSDDPGGQPQDPVQCDPSGVLVDEEAARLEVCGDAAAGVAAVGVRLGTEQDGAADPDGQGVGRLAVTGEGGERRVRLFFEDYTPGNLVMNAIEDANDRLPRESETGKCRLLPDECSEPGVDDKTWDAMLFTPLDLESTTLGPQSVTCAAPGERVAVHFANGHPAGSSTAFPCLHRTGSVAFEPTMGATSKPGMNGWLFYQSARPAAPEQFPDVLRSKDEGQTWAVVSPKTAGENRHQFTFDPVLYVDAVTSRVFTTDFELGCAMVSHSDDGGESWSTVPAVCGTAVDHQTIFAGPPTISETIGYPNVVYYCTPHLVGGQFSIVTVCSKSLDGGLTFVPTGTLPFVTNPETPPEEGNYGLPGYCDGMTGRGVADPVSGRIFVPKGSCGQPHMAFSDDEGARWTVVQVASTGMARTRDNRPDHEANVAVDATGTLYYTWVGHDRQIYLATSQSGGETWSTPLQINPPGLIEADRPDIDVGAYGKVAIVYMGTTDGPEPDAVTGKFPGEGTCPPAGACPAHSEYQSTTWNAYMTVTENLFTDQPRFLTATINNPADPLFKGACGPGGCLGLGDGVTSVTIDPTGTPWGAYFDACADGCATITDRPEGIAGRLAGVSLR